MRLIASISLVFCVYGLASQNWNVFNGNYRYNYKYNYSALISQVIFSDSLSVQGNDTVYYLNRIGVECVGTCPTLTTPLNPTTTVIVPNMPQFLQRSIKKFPNGTVLLYDTAKLVIQTNCQVNQTWLFDSVNNISATCVNKIAQLNFGLSDSVRTILIGNNDTLKLSKNFGLLQFPTLYNQNKYYRLVGIENAGSYDSVALYGSKVPNYWDIQKFEVGDKFCFERSWYMLIGIGGYVNSGCMTRNYTIQNRSIQNNAYVYTVNGYQQNCGSPTITSIFTLSPHNSTLMNENKMYPGQIIPLQFYPDYSNLVKFGLDNNGVFYKYAGKGCTSYSPQNMPFSQAYNGIRLNTSVSPSHYTVSTNFLMEEVYGVGLGNLSNRINPEGTTTQDQHYFSCLTCAVKNGTLYFGTETFVTIPEIMNKIDFYIYPNPGNGRYTIKFGARADALTVFNFLGQVVHSEDIGQGVELKELDLSGLENGVYFIQLKKNGVQLTTQKVIKNGD